MHSIVHETTMSLIKHTFPAALCVLICPFVLGDTPLAMEGNVGKMSHRLKRSLPGSAEIQQIVDKHNELRRIPGASNMRELVGNNI